MELTGGLWDGLIEDWKGVFFCEMGGAMTRILRRDAGRKGRKLY